jgi:amidase
MPVKLATVEQLHELARNIGLDLTDEEASVYQEMLKTTIHSYRRLDQIPERSLPVKYKRERGWKPAPEENTLNGWFWRSEIEGAQTGPLKGHRVAIKDAICVAGLPMSNGSTVLEGYIPDVDATVVTRLLDAGATIVGKSNCEAFSFDAGGHTCDYGPVGNPWKQDHNPGASSNGNAVLLSNGSVHLAIGGDQGGSIRIPASWSGCYGLKPTYGLVPYTGGAMIESTLDHLGPMADSTEGLALLLSAIAGYDPNDPRQHGCIPTGLDLDYMPALNQNVRGMKIAVVKEGFGQDGSSVGLSSSDPETDACVADAINRLCSLGAVVEEVSIPEHLDAYHIWSAIIVEGALAFMVNGNGVGTNWRGWYNSGLAEALARGFKAYAQDLPATVRSAMVRGEYMRRFYNNRYYYKAQNQRHLINAAYDAVLSQYDAIACPTTPTRANKMVGRDASVEETVASGLGMLRNTVVANVTGHPSISIPCGLRDGLPVGLMLTASHWRDDKLLSLSAAFEGLGDWKNM